jgi:hypothetical protein
LFFRKDGADNMKKLSALTPRAAVLDGTADFVVNLADLDSLTEEQARDFLETNVLTAGMELLLMQTFARMAGRTGGIGIYKLSESMGGGKTQAMIVAGILDPSRLSRPASAPGRRGGGARREARRGRHGLLEHPRHPPGRHPPLVPLSGLPGPIGHWGRALSGVVTVGASHPYFGCRNLWKENIK